VALDLEHRDRIYFIGPGCFTTTAPRGPLIYQASRQSASTMPDIYRLSVEDLQTRSSYAPEVALPDADWGHENMPRVSTDNRWLIYAATTGCHDWVACDYEIFLHQIGSSPEQRHRLTYNARNDSFPHMFVPPGNEPPDAGPQPGSDAGIRPDAAMPAPHPPAPGCVLEPGFHRTGAGSGILLALLLIACRRANSGARLRSIPACCVTRYAPCSLRYKVAPLGARLVLARSLPAGRRGTAGHRCKRTWPR
jgi:hypothetical protein